MQENDHPTELEKAAEGRSRPAKLQIIDAKLRPRWRRGARNKRKKRGEKRMLPLPPRRRRHAPRYRGGERPRGRKGKTKRPNETFHFATKLSSNIPSILSLRTFVRLFIVSLPKWRKRGRPAAMTRHSSQSAPIECAAGCPGGVLEDG